MNGKITQNEFKKWSNEFTGIYGQLLRTTDFQNETQREKFLDFGTLVSFYTERGSLWAVVWGLLGLGEGAKRDNKIAVLGGLTLDEWDAKIVQRMRDHCASNGYWNPNSPSTSTSLKERVEKVKKILDDKKKTTELLMYADKEEYKNITDFVNLRERLREMGLKSSGQEEEDPAKDVIFYQVLGFLFEDHAGRVEKLISKKEQTQKQNSPKNDSPTSNSLAPRISSEYKNNLEAEIEQLQSQIKDLENRKNDDKASDNQKETYQKILDNTKKDLADRQKEKDKLDNNKKISEPSNKSNNKLNLAIGLGIGAIVVIGLVCLVLIASRKKES